MRQDLARRKHTIAFAQIDARGGGYITREDLLAIGDQLCSAFQESISSPAAARLIDAMLYFWRSLMAVADADERGYLGVDGFCTAMRTLLLDDPPAFDNFYAPMGHALLAIADGDGDGQLDRQEYTTVHLLLGTHAAHIGGSFRALDADGDGRVRTDDLLAAMYDFYASSCEHAPGNNLFGPVHELT